MPFYVNHKCQMDLEFLLWFIKAIKAIFWATRYIYFKKKITMDRFPWYPPSFQSSSNIYKISVKMLKPRNLSIWLKSHLSPVLLYWYVPVWEIWRNSITGHMWVTLDNIQWNGNYEIMKALLNCFTCYE